MTDDAIEEMTRALQLIATAALILCELIDGEGTQDERPRQRQRRQRQPFAASPIGCATDNHGPA